MGILLLYTLLCSSRELLVVLNGNEKFAEFVNQRSFSSLLLSLWKGNEGIQSWKLLLKINKINLLVQLACFLMVLPIDAMTKLLTTLLWIWVIIKISNETGSLLSCYFPYVIFKLYFWSVIWENIEWLCLD